MTQHHFAPAIFVACVLMAFAGSANAGIVKCIDKAGAVTFTDVPCNINSNTVNVSGVIETAPSATGVAVGIKVLPQAGNFAAAEEVRATAWANKPAANRGLSLDVETLKAAKAAMMSADRASALVRQQTLARL